MDKNKYVDILVIVSKMFPIENKTIKNGNQL